MLVEDLVNLILNPKYSLLFVVFTDQTNLTRVKLPNFEDKESILDFILNNGLRSIETGLDSGEIRFDQAQYIDCYYKYPNK
jgi:hypothetical protein